MNSRRRVASGAAVAMAFVGLAVAVLTMRDTTTGVACSASAAGAVAGVTTITLGDGREGVAVAAAGDTEAWVATIGTAGPHLVRIRDGAVNCEIPLQSVPTAGETGGHGIALHDGSIVVLGVDLTPAGHQLGVLQIVEPTTGTVDSVALGAGTPIDLAIGPVGIWVAVARPDTTLQAMHVNHNNHKVVASADLEGGWISDVTSLGNQVLFHTREVDGDVVTDSILTVVDASTAAVTRVQHVGRGIGPAAAAAGGIWLVDRDALVRVDPGTAENADRSAPIGRSIAQTVLAGDDERLWFLSYDPAGLELAMIERYEVADQKVDLTIDPPHAPRAIALGSASIWILNHEHSVTHIPIDDKPR